MKKVALIALLAVGSVALAASVSVPWFADNADNGCGANPAAKVNGVVTLHNNTNSDLVCTIDYYSQDGKKLEISAAELAGLSDERSYVRSGVAYTSGYNTFTITKNATVLFRPVKDDPDSEAGGNESATGRAVPNRPQYTSTGTFPANADSRSETSGKANGCCVISWIETAMHDASAVSGAFSTRQGVAAGNNVIGMHLLP